LRHQGTAAKDRGPKRAHRSRSRSFRHPLTEIFGVGPILAAKIIGTVGNVVCFPTKAHFASYSGTAPVEVSSGEVVHHRLSLAGNRKLDITLCTWSPSAKPDRTLGAGLTTARRLRRASLARRRCGASRGASPMPSSRALWQICRRLRAAPLDKEEPRTPLPRTRVNKRGMAAEGGRHYHLDHAQGDLRCECTSPRQRWPRLV
jgi:hypothetical protein